MDIRFTHTNLVFGFEDEGFDSNIIYSNQLSIVNSIMLLNKLQIPDDWVLMFDIGYNNGRIPLLSKNKFGTYPSDKMKYIKIVIPIPLESEISWGVKPEQHLYGKDHYDKLIKNFWELAIDYRNYGNRTDYITACIKAGIKKAFVEGFTVGGVKIKAKQPIEI
jgi:hypothetical protein